MGRFEPGPRPPMTSETSHPTAQRGAALLERAAIARHVAAALCRDARGLAEAVSTVDDSFAAEAPSVTRARTTAVELAMTAGVTGERLDAIRLAISEAASNAVMHAYPDGPGDFNLRAAVVGRLLLVRVTDDGCGPDVPSMHPGLGYGLKLIAASTDSFGVKRREHGGTEIVMRWTVA